MRGQTMLLDPHLLESVEDSHWTVRAKAAERLATLYCDAMDDRFERRVLEDLFRRLRYDGDGLMARLLAACLKDAPHLPRDIAVSLAAGPAAIAGGFIEESAALTDEDLLWILRDYPGAHRLAIARRAPLSPGLCDALCRCGEDAVIAATLANDHAAIGAVTLRRLIGEGSETIRDAAARRQLLRLTPGTGKFLAADATMPAWQIRDIRRAFCPQI